MSEGTPAHYVEQPRYQFFIRIAQIVLSVITLILLAITISKSEFSDEFLEQISFGIFACVWTWLVCAYLIVVPMLAADFYNYWAQLALEAVAMIFWFSGFIAIATWVGKYKEVKEYDFPGGGSLGDFDLGSIDDILGSIGRRGVEFAHVYALEKRKGRSSLSSGGGGDSSSKHPTWWITAAVASATSAFMWVLFLASLIIFILAFRRHLADPNKSHLPKSGMPFNAEKAAAAQHEMGNVQAGQPEGAQFAPQPYPQPTATPANVYPVQPTPPPQQWQQSPPPQQMPQPPYGQA